MCIQGYRQRLYCGGSSYDIGGTSTHMANTDIVMFAIDYDEDFIYVGRNGTWYNSGDPTSGSSGTGNINKSEYGGIGTFTMANKFIMPVQATQGTTDYPEMNFGSPFYANSSDAADANGYGAFEYAPPSGYFALCTKNLAEYG